MQKAEEDHRVEIKVYMQKVKHLEYEHGNQCKEVDAQAKKEMSKELKHHTDNEKEMRKDKVNERKEME